MNYILRWNTVSPQPLISRCLTFTSLVLSARMYQLKPFQIRWQLHPRDAVDTFDDATPAPGHGDAFAQGTTKDVKPLYAFKHLGAEG